MKLNWGILIYISVIFVNITKAVN